MDFFTVYPTFDAASPLDYFRLVSHVFGHASIAHLLGNMMFLLLIGPLMEERYGSKHLLAMIAIVALLTGILNVLFFPKGLLGASGIVFMLIILSSFNNLKQGYIPLTFILVFLIYLAKEVYLEFTVQDNVSHFAHILGGSLGSIYGFMYNRVSG
jgi:GlpG protein